MSANVYFSYPGIYVGYFTDSRLSDIYDRFNEQRPWMKHPFLKSRAKLNVQFLDLSMGVEEGLLRYEWGWTLRRFYFDAYNTDSRVNADQAQFVRFNLQAIYFGVGLNLLKRLISPGVSLEFGQLQLSTYQGDRSLKLSSRTGKFDNALSEGVNRWMTFLNMSVQIRIPTKYDELFLLIQPFYLMGLKQIDLTPFDRALNPELKRKKFKWKPEAKGVKIALMVFL